MIAVDLCCGAQPYRDLVEPYVSRYIPVDVASNPLAEAHIDPRTEQVSLETGSADVIISTQVLEHTESPPAYLVEARRICSDKGLLILSTHGIWKYHPKPEDYWRWTCSGLRKLVEAHGWHVEEMRGILGLPAVSLQLFQDWSAQLLPEPIFTGVAIVMQRSIALVDSLTSPNDITDNAGVIIVVAGKMPEAQPDDSLRAYPVTAVT